MLTETPDVFIWQQIWVWQQRLVANLGRIKEAIISAKYRLCVSYSKSHVVYKRSSAWATICPTTTQFYSEVITSRKFTQFTELCKLAGIL